MGDLCLMVEDEFPPLTTVTKQAGNTGRTVVGFTAKVKRVAIGGTKMSPFLSAAIRGIITRYIGVASNPVEAKIRTCDRSKDLPRTPRHVWKGGGFPIGGQIADTCKGV